MKSISMMHMDMGPHMKMAELRPPKPGGQERANEIVAKLRPAIEKYRDVKVADADGYKRYDAPGLRLETLPLLRFKLP
jgi:hypothetical protein